MVKKILIESRLPNLMTYVVKGHVKSVKTYMMKFNGSILNRLKIMGFLQIQKKYINQEGLNKKEIELNLCNAFSIFIFDELYLFV